MSHRTRETFSALRLTCAPWQLCTHTVQMFSRLRRDWRWYRPTTHFVLPPIQFFLFLSYKLSDSASICIPAETNLLVEHQCPLQGPAQPVLKPALAAKHRWQADGRRHIAGWSALPQVGQEKARAAALAHCVQSSCGLPVADVAHSLTQIRRVTKLLQFEGGERRPVVAAAVEDCRQVAMGQRRFTQL